LYNPQKKDRIVNNNEQDVDKKRGKNEQRVSLGKNRI